MYVIPAEQQLLEPDHLGLSIYQGLYWTSIQTTVNKIKQSTYISKTKYVSILVLCILFT